MKEIGKAFYKGKNAEGGTEVKERTRATEPLCSNDKGESNLEEFA